MWTNELHVAGGPLKQETEGEAQPTGEAQIIEGVFDKQWGQLTKAELKAAKKIGYTKASWYESAPPKDVPYTALSSAEKAAAESLGWEEELWENERKAMTEESGGSDGVAHGQQDQEGEDDELVEVSGAFDKEWTELSKSEAKAAKRLGYTAINWYDNAPPKLVPWHTLSKAQAKAARKLGWVRCGKLLCAMFALMPSYQLRNRCRLHSLVSARCVFGLVVCAHMCALAPGRRAVGERT